MVKGPFSQRQGCQPPPKPISVRDDAPIDFRFAVVSLAEKEGFRPKHIRRILCDTLMVRPDPSNWNDYPNVHDEVTDQVDNCPWYLVYDLAEALYERLNIEFDSDQATSYQDGLNRFMIEDGIGWEMKDGVFVARGAEGFISAVSNAEHELQETGRPTAAREIHEALSDLSRRPEPDLTGAVHHAMNALECLLKDMSDEPSKTLGAIIQTHSERFGIPAPLDKAIEKMWGFASQKGRHLTEGKEPTFKDAELIVTICAGLCGYLTRER